MSHHFFWFGPAVLFHNSVFSYQINSSSTTTYKTTRNWLSPNFASEICSAKLEMKILQGKEAPGTFEFIANLIQLNQTQLLEQRAGFLILQNHRARQNKGSRFQTNTGSGWKNVFFETYQYQLKTHTKTPFYAWVVSVQLPKIFISRNYKHFLLITWVWTHWFPFHV